MQLLGPLFLRVHPAKSEHHERSELSVFLRRNFFSCARLGKNAGGGFFGTEIRETMVHAVIGQAAAVVVKVLMSLFQRFEERGETADVLVGRLRKPADPLV